MLFKPLGTSRLQRIQGAYVSEEEVALVVEQCRAQREQELDESLLEAPEKPADDDDVDEDGEFDPDEDPLLEKAIEVVVQAQTASVSLLQRRLRVGYTRAGRLIDMLERRGIISPYEGSKPRARARSARRETALPVLRWLRASDRGRRELRRRADVRLAACARARRDGDRDALSPRPRREGVEPGGRRCSARRRGVVPDGGRRGRVRRRRVRALGGGGRRCVVGAALVEPTMTAAILVEETGDNRIVIVPGALSALTPAHVDGFAAQIAAADVLLVQLEIPVETALHALEVGRRGGRAHDPEPGAAPAEPIAPDADYLVPNEREAPAVAGRRDARAHARRRRGRGSGTRSCRRSRRGSWTRPAPATRSARRSRSRWPRAPRTSKRALGLRRRRAHGRARGRASPGCRRAPSSSARRVRAGALPGPR